MTKKTNNYDDDDSYILEDEDEDLREDADEDFDLEQVKTDDNSSKRRLIEERLDEYKLKRQLEDEFDF